MTSRLTVYYRDIPAGNGINDATAIVHRHIDDEAILSRATAGSSARRGGVTFTRAELGYPGPVWAEITANGQRKVDSGTVITQVGPFWLDDIPDALSAFGLGTFRGLVPSAGGTMAISVSAGAGIFKDGLPYVLEANTVVATVAPAHLSQPRIDRLVLRQTRRGQGEEGKYVWLLIAGTAAASPLPPNIVQDTQFWDFSFAQIRVEAGATAISASKLTDERYSTALGQGFIPTFPAGLIVGDLFTVNAAGQVIRLALPATADRRLGVNLTTKQPEWTLPTNRAARGFFAETDSASASQTTDTTNTAVSVLALQTPATLPAGTWTVKVAGGLALLREAAGSSYLAIEVEGDEQQGRTFGVSIADYQAFVTSRSVSGIPGNQDINLRVRFRSVTSGRTHARNPWLTATFERTG